MAILDVSDCALVTKNFDFSRAITIVMLFTAGVGAVHRAVATVHIEARSFFEAGGLTIRLLSDVHLLVRADFGKVLTHTAKVEVAVLIF